MLGDLAETDNLGVRELLRRDSVHVVPANEYRQIAEVGKFFIRNDTVGGSFTTGSRCSTSPMNKKLHLGGEIIVDHILEEGNINTTSGQISNEHKVDSLASEVSQLLLPGELVHGTVDKVCFESCLDRQLTQILHVVPRRSEDDRLLALLHLLSQSVDECGFFLVTAHDEEVNFELI